MGRGGGKQGQQETEKGYYGGGCLKEEGKVGKAKKGGFGTEEGEKDEEQKG